MRPLTLILTTLLIVGFGLNRAFAHPGHENDPNLRVWNLADGNVQIDASFMLAKDDQIQLCQHDGSTVWLPLDQLSEADQTWVRTKLEAVRQLNQVPEIPIPQTPRPESQSPTLLRFFAPALIIAFVMAFFASLGNFVRNPSRDSVVIVSTILLVGSLGLVAAEGDQKGPLVKSHFEPFKEKLELRVDDNFLYVGSNGFPDHPMMVGIKAWQQQVPLPQPFTGKNSWQIPLHPKLADKPISAKTALFRGAIALAVNGVPIFNALNNRGEDTYLAGELDDFGGHCGRGDDYHYHMAPVHLEKVVGKGKPIAYALDGFPIFGYTDSTGKEPTDLDEFNGRMEKDGYRYYSTKKFPYINGGMRGVVTVRGDQIEPQPKDAPVRPAGQPLRGATITGFTRDDEKKTYTLKYDVQGAVNSITYSINKDNTYTFVYKDSSGKETTETYRRREGKDGPPPKKEGKDGPGPKKDRKDGPPPKKEDDAPRPKKNEEAPVIKNGAFKVTSPAFEQGGKFPIEFTGDGDGISPPIAWSGAPTGTKFYALQLWHIPGPGDVKSYWAIYNIPATVTSLAKGTKGIGKAGYNDKNRTDYDPMKSKGPGVKEYHITVYALSAEPKFSTDKVNRSELLSAIKDITLAEGTLSYKYERQTK